MESWMVRVSRTAMGTEFQAILVGPDADYLRDAGNQALDEVERLEAQISHYRPDSDLADVNRRAGFGPVRLEPGFFRLLQRALALSRETEGAFDPTAGALVRAWGFFRGQGRLPDDEALAEARAATGAGLVELDPEGGTVRFLHPGVQLHLGALGKGAAVDRAVETLRELRVESALVHGGTSTVYALGAPPNQEHWAVGLCDPRDRDRRLGVVPLRDRALSTSGDYEQFFEVDGMRYSHLIDPRTGFPARGVRSATVLADSAADTDALSTAAFVLGSRGAHLVLNRFPGVGLILAPEPEEGEAEPVLCLGAAKLLPAETESVIMPEQRRDG